MSHGKIQLCNGKLLLSPAGKVATDEACCCGSECPCPFDQTGFSIVTDSANTGPGMWCHADLADGTLRFITDVAHSAYLTLWNEWGDPVPPDPGCLWAVEIDTGLIANGVDVIFCAVLAYFAGTDTWAMIIVRRQPDGVGLVYYGEVDAACGEDGETITLTGVLAGQAPFWCGGYSATVSL